MPRPCRPGSSLFEPPCSWAKKRPTATMHAAIALAAAKGEEMPGGQAAAGQRLIAALGEECRASGASERAGPR